ncbi:hypothetical protein DAPPUDRAFT_332487 [Daphnia pulex]|uniref:Uncharacterized protein n=1 Tax=Daphnia pulex TaxID=6669 RepID=E9HQ38_DAPPU|nr:hypothetical protein DAPPUDRAFT_332487 [Daphnia pulex]|eukprot:EFX66149.1 hypothetical protein DAPPUDRAFT_332487 [Daphnia pulex]
MEYAPAYHSIWLRMQPPAFQLPCWDLSASPIPSAVCVYPTQGALMVFVNVAEAILLTVDIFAFHRLGWATSASAMINVVYPKSTHTANS